MNDSGVALGELGLAIDDEASFLMMLVPEVHLGAGLDRRFGQREAEAVVTHQEPLGAPVLTTHVALRALDLLPAFERSCSLLVVD